MLTGCTSGRGAAPATTHATGAPTASAPASAPSPSPTTAPSITRGVSTLGVLGDSISLGVNACEQPGECPAASWAMGTEPSVDSVATRIERQTGRRPSIANGAVSGGTVSTLLQSVHAVVAARPQLVMILIGANDACRPSVEAMTSASAFRRDYGQVLDTVLGALPSAHVLALSVPDLYQLWQAGDTSPAASSTWSEFDICGSLLSGSGATDAASDQRREAVRERVVDYNQSIAQLCSARNRCISDGGAIYAQSFTTAELSELDYFHPSIAGQRKIAELAWRALQRAS